MLIWLNGAHGAGKTSVARQLVAGRRAWLIDPEHIGFMLRRLWPGGGPDDFKELPLWRELTLRAIRAAAADPAFSTFVVPMTLSNPDHFEEVVGGLRTAGIDVRHFTLTAGAETLRHRIRRRLDWPASKQWALSRIDRCSAALQDPAFATHVPTDGRRARDVAGEIMNRLDLNS
jgi:predicted kinase